MESLAQTQNITAITQLPQRDDAAARNARSDADFVIDGSEERGRGNATRQNSDNGAVHLSLDTELTSLVEEFAENMRTRLDELNVDLNRRITVKVDDRHIIHVVNEHPEQNRIEDELNKDVSLRERFARLADRMAAHENGNEQPRGIIRKTGISAYKATEEEGRGSQVRLNFENDKVWAGLGES